MHLTRRILCSASLLPWAGLACAPAMAAPLSETVAALERRRGGRLGVAWLDTASGRMAGHRLDERFALCSTFKLLLAAAVLHQVDEGRLQLQQWVPLSEKDRVPHAPVAGPAVSQGGLSLETLTRAMQTTSDNMAANALLQLLEGPQGLTAWLRRQGDAVTRIDRWEPEMNRVTPGELHDTTTPAAMARITARLVLDSTLSTTNRDRLQDWMVQTRTGQRRLRARLPPGWRAGDKTGTFQHPHYADKLNDVAVLWPPGRQAPLVVAAYYESPVTTRGAMRDADQAVLADVGRWASGASL